MKRRLVVLAILTFALILVTAEPQRTSANNWPEDFGQCVDAYGGAWFQCWDYQWSAHDNCDIMYPVPPSANAANNAQCKNNADMAKLGCLSTYTTDFVTCTGHIDYGFEQIDFCSNAIQAAAACEQFQGEDNLDAKWACLSASMINLCQ